MGIWGPGLYSGDLAADLRSTIRAVARLPFDGDRLLEILCDTEPTAATNPQDEDHTTFWLVVADQFARRAIACEAVREKALQIIDSGENISMLTSLGMKPADIKKRQKMLAELRTQLIKPASQSTPRSVLKNPQPFLMEIGDVFAYPSSKGNSINPYFPSKEHMPGGWHPDGWNIAIIVDRGRAFDFLAWYRPLVAGNVLPDKPNLGTLRLVGSWSLRSPGTCSAKHLKKMEMEKIAVLPIDRAKLDRLFPRMSGVYQAVNDISVANHLEILERPIPSPRPDPTILNLTAISFAS